jgi:hypothetical protein
VRPLVLLLLALTACDMPRATCGSGDATTLDVNGEGRPDVRTVVIGGPTVCRESDLDFDGAPDVVRVTDIDGNLQWLGQDLDFDGRVDRLEHHEGGALVEEMIDLDGDGRPDLRRRYRDGKLLDEPR